MAQLKVKRDPEGTRRRILAAAAEEFAKGGLSGARVDQIARRALTNERMLYYYFGSKEQLFVAVLEQTLDNFVEAERALDLDGLDPVKAITTLAHFVWQYYRDHPELLCLINNENLHQGRYLQTSTRVREMMSPMLEILSGVIDRGHRAGLFRENVDPVAFYATLSALGYYVLSNRFTLAATLGRDFAEQEHHAAIVRMNTDVVLAYLLTPSASLPVPSPTAPSE